MDLDPNRIQKALLGKSFKQGGLNKEDLIRLLNHYQLDTTGTRKVLEYRLRNYFVDQNVDNSPVAPNESPGQKLIHFPNHLVIKLRDFCQTYGIDIHDPNKAFGLPVSKQHVMADETMENLYRAFEDLDSIIYLELSFDTDYFGLTVIITINEKIWHLLLPQVTAEREAVSLVYQPIIPSLEAIIAEALPQFTELIKLTSLNNFEDYPNYECYQYPAPKLTQVYFSTWGAETVIPDQFFEQIDDLTLDWFYLLNYDFVSEIRPKHFSRLKINQTFGYTWVNLQTFFSKITIDEFDIKAIKAVEIYIPDGNNRGLVAPLPISRHILSTLVNEDEFDDVMKIPQQRIGKVILDRYYRLIH